jgi:hypothetical protein
VIADPFTSSELLEESTIETARNAVIDIFHRSLLAEFRIAQTRKQPLLVPPGSFAIEQKRQPFGMIEGRGIAGGFDLAEGLRHAKESQGMELIEGRMGKQSGFS